MRDRPHPFPLPRHRRRARLLPLVGVLLAAGAEANALTAEGSLFVEAGPALVADGVPEGSAPEWSGGALASTRIAGAGTNAELAIEGKYLHDAVLRTDAVVLEEAWAAWKPAAGLALRLGRQRIGFGCGLAWSVVDDLDPQPMPFDPHSPRPGLDALRLAADLAAVGAQVQVSLEIFAPRDAGSASLLVIRGGQGTLQPGAVIYPTRLDQLGAAAQLSAFFGGIELGAAGSVGELDVAPPVSVGGWATVDIAGFVFGAEGAWRRQAAEFLLNVNRRMGDFTAMGEARWIPDRDRVWLFGQVSWSRAELGASISALVSVREPCGLVDLGFSCAATDDLVLSLGTTLYEKPGEIPEIGPLPWRCTVALGAEFFF